MIRRFTAGSYGVNIYVIYDEKEKVCAIVDPGEFVPALVKFIDDKELKVTQIILTHGHGDHLNALPKYLEKFESKVLAHKSERELLGSSKLNFSKSMCGEEIVVEPDRWLIEGDFIDIGSMSWKVIHTPGHTKGGICLYHGEWLIAGDTLFFESIGRFDLYGGNYLQLKASILDKLMVLPDEVIVYPGHGSETTIGYEKKNNRLIR
jgi:glyoxylase-like metal-dependent hydrolase (beta-lactamase superfamily II)